MTAPRVIYLGIRTEKSAAEVGGWSKIDKMGFRDALIYDTATRKYHNYTKSEITDLVAKLQAADLVVGFNQLNFDYKILSAYTEKDLATLPNFDMLNRLEQTLNFRVSRDNLAANTLDSFKNEKAYTNVTDRVETNKKLFAHACKEGCLFYENKRFGGKDRCDTSNWAETARNLCQKNKLVADIKESINNNISKHPDDSIPKPPTPPVKISNEKVEEIDSSLFIGNNKISEFTIEAKQIFEKTTNRHARVWYAYNEFARRHGPVLSFHQFMTALGRVSKSTKPKKELAKKGSLFSYIDQSGTLAFERVVDYLDIRNIKEELARGI